MLEHRYYQRRPVHYPITLRTRSGRLLRCQVTDCCLEGMGVECHEGDPDELHEGAVVEVLTSNVRDGEERERPPHCYVVHAGNGRLGLMWIEADSAPPCLELSP